MRPSLTITPRPPTASESSRLARLGRAILTRRRTYVLMGLVILALDAPTGPYVSFPILFLLPVVLAAWNCRGWTATALAAALPIGRALLAGFIFLEPLSLRLIAVNAAARILVLLVIVYYVQRASQQREELRREVRMLKGILPICVSCKRIRDKREQWQPMEVYIAERSEAEFSHGYCPECEAKLMASFTAVEPPDDKNTGT